MKTDSNSTNVPAQTAAANSEAQPVHRDGPLQPTEAVAGVPETHAGGAIEGTKIDSATIRWMPLVVPLLGLMLGLAAALIEWAVLQVV